MSEYIYHSQGEPLTNERGEIYLARADKIVRCRDCKHVVHRPEWQPDKRFKPIDLWVCEAEWCMGFEGDHPDVTPDGFCKWGEPREESC